MTPSTIETATFPFVAQHLNHCATAVPDLTKYATLITAIMFLDCEPTTFLRSTGCSCLWFDADEILDEVVRTFTALDHSRSYTFCAKYFE